MDPMQPYNTTIFEIEEKNYEIAVLPVGSFEQHGPHLPLTTDNIIAQALADGIAEKLDAFCLPVLPLSTCREHMGKRGSTWMDSDVFYAMMRSILESLKEQGFRRVVIIQAHGGIFAMTPVVRHMNAVNTADFLVYRLEPLALYPALMSEGLIETADNVHACEFETSVLLHLRPDLVKTEKIRDFVPSCPRDALNYDGLFRVSPSGVWGHPEKATAKKGKQLLERSIELSVKLVEENFAFASQKKYYGCAYNEEKRTW